MIRSPVSVCLMHLTPLSNCQDLSNSNKVRSHVVRCFSWSAVHLSYRSDVSICSFVKIVVVIPSPCGIPSSWLIYFGRAFNEFHITGRNVTELIGLVDTVGKTALDMLNQFILCWALVNDVEQRYGMPLTPIYAITSMTSDTTSSMSGEHGGFQALFEQALGCLDSR